jgi:hypothetical protein
MIYYLYIQSIKKNNVTNDAIRIITHFLIRISVFQLENCFHNANRAFSHSSVRSNAERKILNSVTQNSPKRSTLTKDYIARYIVAHDLKTIETCKNNNFGPWL